MQVQEEELENPEKGIFSVTPHHVIAGCLYLPNPLTQPTRMPRYMVEIIAVLGLSNARNQHDLAIYRNRKDIRL